MNIEKLISLCVEQGVELALEDGALEVYFDEEPSEDLLALLRQHKSDIVAFLSDKSLAARHPESHQAIERVERTSNLLPLSFSQQRLWLVDQLDGASAQYNLFSAMRFTGQFEMSLAQQAFTQLIARHEPLRTIFVTEGDSAYQCVQETFSFQVQLQDLSHLEVAAQEEQLKAALQMEAEHVFNLARDLMLRAGCIRTSANSGVLLINVHHIAADGWSLRILIDEFVHIYGQLAKGESSTLPELAIRYADYAQWQREHLSGPYLERQIAYWQQTLAGLPQVHSLALDKARPPQPSFHGAVKELLLAPALLQQIQALAQAQGVTLFMVLHAALALLFARYSRDTDIVIGTPIANRRRKELETLVGFFANTLVLRTKVDGQLSFIEFLQQVKEVNLAAQDNQDAPFEVLVERLNPVRSHAHAPLFQLMFAMNSSPAVKAQMSQLEMQTVRAEEVAAKFDLSVNAQEVANGLQFQFEYSLDVFEGASIARMTQHFAQLLEQIVQAPTQAMQNLQFISQDERRHLVQLGQDAKQVFATDLALHRMIEKTVQAQPDAIALVFDNQQLSYRELNQQANRLARYLREQGIGPDNLVGICVERSLDMVLAMLAVLKAGAAYVPLDPAYPAARLEYMVTDSGLSLVLSQEAIAQRMNFASAQIVCMDEADYLASVKAYADTDLADMAQQSLDNLAYVIYTSGSTGKPKGVMLEHRSVVNFLYSIEEVMGGADAVWLSLTSISFDISVLEIFGALVYGKRLVIAPKQGLQTSASELETLQPMQFSLFYFASSASENTENIYELLIEGAKFADQHGFTAVWTPERHFAAFGGVYPNPAITGAVVASHTKNVQIRAGSCVLPLNDPLKVAEDWAVVDNLSNGRVGLAFASGWNPNDFALAPDNFKQRHQVLYDGIKTFSQFWQGEGVMRKSGLGHDIEVKLFPRPKQTLPPIWITAAGSEHTFRSAGEMGANVLTHLLGQTLGELDSKIKQYQQAWREAGHAGMGHVTLMVHTYVAETDEEALQEVKEPFKQYLGTSLSLINGIREEIAQQGDNPQLDSDAVLEIAFKRYYKSAALFGSSERCASMVRKLMALGVAELACLIDFGVANEKVLHSLQRLNDLKQQVELALHKQNEQAQAPSTAISLGSLIEQQGVTHMQCTPSYAAIFLADQEERRKLSQLRSILVGGEACPGALALDLGEVCKGDILNMYGPTEATVWASKQKIIPAQLSASAAGHEVAIGKPLANYQMYVVDPAFNLVPYGVPGELLIAGAGLARGYLHRPELSQERFIQLALGNGQTVRAYRTGDLARYLPDGALQFLGRIDEQIKIRGFRIELGEIEAQLLLNPEVQAAAAVVQTVGANDKRLLAFVVLHAGHEAAEKEVSKQLRKKLAHDLPDYMVPGAITVLKSLPMTANGKIDRNALPKSDVSQLGNDYVAPSSAAEIEMIEIWADLLKLDTAQIGVNDNFFDLGGHSLLFMRLSAEIRSRFQVELSIREAFELPTLGQLVAVLSAKKGGLTEPEQQPVRRVERTSSLLPLSFGQQRLWLVDQLGGASAQYNVFSATRFTGQFEIPIAQRAFTQLIERHEPLRTIFVTDGDTAYQSVQESFNFQIQEQDLSALDLATQEAKVKAAIVMEAEHVFNLAQDLMLRAAFIRTGANTGVLLINLHHIAADGWSLRILFEEFVYVYAQMAKGESSALPELAVRYADYAQWQREHLSGPKLERQIGYWQQALAGLPQVHSLALDKPRPPQPSFHGALHDLLIAQPLLQKLKALSQAQGVTLFMTMHAALALLFSRYSRDADIVIGTPIANRRHKEFETLIGFFANTLVLRTKVDGQLSFQAFLQQVKEVNLAAQDNQDVPFEVLVERLNPARSQAHSPLFQLMFAMNTTPMVQAQMSKLEMQSVRFDEVAAKFDLSVNVLEGIAGLHVQFEYSLDLFEAATIARMAQHFSHLLAQIVQTPEQTMHSLQLISFDERKQLLQLGQQATQDFGNEIAVHRMFEQSVQAQPDALALVFEDQQWSYRELNQQANRLARDLRERGIGRDSLVGICVERSMDMVLALLGVLKAGAAYVPLDPAYPQARLEYMVTDSGLSLVLSQTAIAEQMQFASAQMVCMDDAAYLSRVSAFAATDLDDVAEQSLDNLAYVIYTSGSTGKPKGVMLEHRSVVNFLHSIEDVMGGKDAVWLSLTSISFDISVLEIFGALVYGKRLVIAPKQGVQSNASLGSLIQQQGVSHMQCTPSFAAILLDDQAERSKMTGLRSILVGGEACPTALAQELCKVSSGEVLNMYGPTEATVWASKQKISSAQLAAISGSHEVAIGKPLANYQLYVVDPAFNLLPYGVPGELLIAGLGLARGYLHRPELTEERFVKLALGDGTSVRAYRTGDLVKYLAGGELQFLGRIDEQIKIRGFRVELGEIEAQLLLNPEVQSAAAVVQTVGPNDKRLLAFVVLHTGQDAAQVTSRLKQKLAHDLPDYMVPGAITVLPALPMTANGKIDRNALPQSDVIQLGKDYVAPSHPSEIALVEIWANLLKLETGQIGVNDNFFDLGGHSLLLMRLSAEIRNRFQVDLTIREAFELATLGQLAQRIEQKRPMQEDLARFEKLRNVSPATHQEIVL